MGIKTIIIAIIAVTAVGGGAYYLTNKDDSNNSEKQNQSSQGLGGNKSIKDLLASGENIRCTYNHTDDSGNTSTGNVFIAGEKLRGSFSVQNAKGTQNSNILRDDTHQYVWQDGSNKGFKTEITALETEGEDSKSDDQKQPVDQDTNYEFDCAEWSVDETLFNAPGNVNFNDYSKQLEQSQQLQNEVRGNQQQACAQLSGQARQACEDAL